MSKLSKKVTHRKMQLKYINGAVYMRENGKDHYLCRHTKLVKVLTDIVTRRVKVEIEYVHNGKYYELELDRSDFRRIKLLERLTSVGIDVNENNIDFVSEMLLKQEEMAVHSNNHEKLGWHREEGILTFLHYDAIGYPDGSRYIGKLNLKPKGSLENKLRGIQTYVKGRSELEMICSVALAASVSSRLKELVGTETLLFHSYGPSSTGKTTAISLGLSLYGYPGKDKGGLQKSWAATRNALVGELANVHGIPIGFDESSLKTNFDFTSLIYTMAEGRDKARMSKEGINKESADWSNTILSTGESSLLANSNANQGLRVRSTEFAGLNYTESGEHAIQLKNLAFSDYGHVGPEFAKHLIDIEDDDLVVMYENAKEHVMSKMFTTDAFTHRVVGKFAIVYLTVSLANKYLDLDFDSEAVLEILIQADQKQMADRNLSKRAYEYVMSEISRNINKFSVKYGQVKHRTPTGEVIGLVKRTKNGKEIEEIAVIAESVRKMLLFGGFSNPEVILKEWQKLNVINVDENKNTKKRTIVPKSPAVRCVVFAMKNCYEKDNASNFDDSSDDRNDSDIAQLFDDDVA